ncbi:hypothetical protein V8C42DRAFT_338059 [Trichoderma barbatum]
MLSNIIQTLDMTSVRASISLPFFSSSLRYVFILPTAVCAFLCFSTLGPVSRSVTRTVVSFGIHTINSLVSTCGLSALSGGVLGY